MNDRQRERVIRASAEYLILIGIVLLAFSIYIEAGR